MTNEETQQQDECGDLNGGKVGYLRAAVWNWIGNAILLRLMYEVFNLEKWCPEKGKLQNRFDTLLEGVDCYITIDKDYLHNFKDFVELAELKLDLLGEGKVWLEGIY